MASYNIGSLLLMMLFYSAVLAIGIIVAGVVLMRLRDFPNPRLGQDIDQLEARLDRLESRLDLLQRQGNHKD